MNVKRSGLILKPDSARVLFRPFEPFGDQRKLNIVSRIMGMSEQEAELTLDQVTTEFKGRHHRLRTFFLERFNAMKSFLTTDGPISETVQMLIGAYFTNEYSLESAALFNPSMVWHPDQSGLPFGSRRFILSLRATGEGHISSITFRSGIIDPQNRITLDPASRFVTAPRIEQNGNYDRQLFEWKLRELGLSNDFSNGVLDMLGQHFTMRHLIEKMTQMELLHHSGASDNARTSQGMLALAQSNYEVIYTIDQHLSERVIFPSAPSESNGIEDARFVQFTDSSGGSHYYATYTAYDGKVIYPQLLKTDDFLRFQISTLNGPEVQNKGMALFPRMINGHYAMISRQDNENIYIMFSHSLNFWYTKQVLLKPVYPWEFVQLGNCGSPIETDAGWLLLTHGVGPVRKYSMGAVLLDLNDPTQVIGRMQEPLLTADNNEREGYVPNVVYSCGAAIHGEDLIIPYAMSDYASSIATVPVREVLNSMK